MGEQSKERWCNATSQLGAYALRRLEADSVENYVAVVLDESQLMAEILLVENDVTHSDRTQRRTFNTWMGQMARTGYMIDTCSDLIKDYNEGNMKIHPTPRVAGVLAHHAMEELVSFAKVTPLPVYSAIIHLSVTKAFEKARMRDFWSKQFVPSKQVS